MDLKMGGNHRILNSYLWEYSGTDRPKLIIGLSLEYVTITTLNQNKNFGGLDSQPFT